jgi:hypothetical protein
VRVRVPGPRGCVTAVCVYLCHAASKAASRPELTRTQGETREGRGFGALTGGWRLGTRSGEARRLDRAALLVADMWWMLALAWQRSGLQRRCCCKHDVFSGVGHAVMESVWGLVQQNLNWTEGGNGCWTDRSVVIAHWSISSYQVCVSVLVCQCVI